MPYCIAPPPPLPPIPPFCCSSTVSILDISTHGSGVYMGLEPCLIYCVEWNTRNARPARKSRDDSSPATGLRVNPVQSGTTYTRLQATCPGLPDAVVQAASLIGHEVWMWRKSFCICHYQWMFLHLLLSVNVSASTVTSEWTYLTLSQKAVSSLCLQWHKTFTLPFSFSLNILHTSFKWI